MKRLWRGLKIFVSLLVLMVLVVFALRAVNDWRYRTPSQEGIESLWAQALRSDPEVQALFSGAGGAVREEPLGEEGALGFHLMPEHKLHPGVVVCTGGSEGSPNLETARFLAQQGFETCAVTFFGGKGQRPTLSKIPLEGFGEVLKALEGVVSDLHPLTLLGQSKGAEYFAQVALHFDQVDNLVLIAPSAYTFAGLDFGDYGSSWTWQGKELPYVDLKKGSLTASLKDMVVPTLLKSPIRFRRVYSSAVEKDPQAEEKRIPLEGFKGRVLLIAGQDDQLWDSASMAQTLALHKRDATLALYPQAGHLFWVPQGLVSFEQGRILTGGTAEGNQRAALQSTIELMHFLLESHR